ncbi:MAG TPA: hypothetical protein VHE37_03260, partial [Nevskiaceae bacterium]|nr:hypothetical protein [Nevskiaceae bacterium]
ATGMVSANSLALLSMGFTDEVADWTPRRRPVFGRCAHQGHRTGRKCLHRTGLMDVIIYILVIY